MVAIRKGGRTEEQLLSSHTAPIASASRAPPNPWVTISSGEDSTAGICNKYERRPRHKTKEDRYEPKAAFPSESSIHHSKKIKKRKTATRKNRKHTWANESFKATNAKQGRLSVSPHDDLVQ
jgi:hypothetical protein